MSVGPMVTVGIGVGDDGIASATLTVEIFTITNTSATPAHPAANIHSHGPSISSMRPTLLC